MPPQSRRGPADWPTAPERRYAAKQVCLADRYGLDVDSAVADTAAGPIHYLEAGDADGEPVLLLHGFSAPAAIWLPLVPALEDGYRLVAPDMPVEGLSGVPGSLRTLMDEVGSFGRITPLADLRTEIVDIERLTAFIWGTEDYYWTTDVGRRVAARMADAEFHALEDHGHGPWLEPGDEAATLVRAFLDG